MEYRSILYGPVYELKGVDARLVLRSGQAYDGLKAIDQTAGIPLPGSIEVETLRPAARMLVGELQDRGIDVDALDDAMLTLNDAVWRVTSNRKMPSPQGALDGEIYLLLEEA